MKTPGSMNSAETGQTRQPMMLKNKGPYRTLDIKIGEIQLELWDYCKPVADPYACLVFLAGPDPAGTDEIMELGNDAQPHVMLDQLSASALAHAIALWVDSLSSYLKGDAALSLTAEFESLRVSLYDPSAHNSMVRAELTLRGPDAHQYTATLTYLEARLLADMLDTIVPDDQDEADR